MKLSEEKKKELREVKECCKIDVGEFKDKYEKLNRFDKLVVYLAVTDEDYEYEEDETLDEEKNKEVIEFMRSDKESARILLNAIRSGEKIVDENGNEYDTSKNLQRHIFNKYDVSWRNHQKLTYFDINSLKYLLNNNSIFKPNDTLYLEIVSDDNEKFIQFASQYDEIYKYIPNINFDIIRKKKIIKIIKENEKNIN